jgi:hypothetical protein
MLMPKTNIPLRLKESPETIAQKEQAEREKDSVVLMSRSYT